MQDKVDSLVEEICSINDRITELETTLKGLRRRLSSPLTHAADRVVIRKAITSHEAEQDRLTRRLNKIRDSYVQTGEVALA